MTDNIENVVLEILKSIQADIRDIRSKQDETLVRITQLETAMLSVKREIAYVFEADIHQNHRNDRINQRLDRIERRLDLHD